MRPLARGHLERADHRGRRAASSITLVFEVKNLAAFCRKLEAAGITLDEAYSAV
jgi:hypothetical protein